MPRRASFLGGRDRRGCEGGGPRGPRGPLLLDWFRLAAAAMMTMAVVTTTAMEAGIAEGKYNNQLKASVEAMVVMAMATAMA